MFPKILLSVGYLFHFFFVYFFLYTKSSVLRDASEKNTSGISSVFEDTE